MDIALTSMYLSQSNVKSDASILLMKKAIDMVEEKGDAIAEMMETTSVVGSDGHVDVSV